MKSSEQEMEATERERESSAVSACSCSICIRAFDALGNWSTNTTSSGTQTRTSDSANEIASISGNWAQPTYDAAGNMTTIPAAGSESTSLRLTYDAWNHVIKVMRNTAPPPYEGWVTFATYSYDGLGRLVNTGEMPGQIEFYYNEQYQIIEQRYIVNGGSYQQTTQYVWDQRYIDAPVMAFETGHVPGQTDTLTKYYFAEDANFDVTLRMKEDGTVTGRAIYTPYGERTVLSSTWGTGTYAIGDLGHQGLMLLNDSGATGLYYNRARFYHPTLGAFIHRDLKVYTDGMNTYEYVQCKPNRSLDAFGLGSTVISYPWPGVDLGGGFVPVHIDGKDIAGGLIFAWVLTHAAPTDCPKFEHPNEEKARACKAACEAVYDRRYRICDAEPDAATRNACHAAILHDYSECVRGCNKLFPTI